MTNIQINTIKAEILTPIHIWSGKDYDRMNYFIDYKKKIFKLVKETWIEDLSCKDKDGFPKIINSIKQGDFKTLESLKDQYYNEYFDEKFVIEEISIFDKAFELLKNTGLKNNQGIIKQHFLNILSKKPVIPGSTLKGIFRTIYFFYKYFFYKYGNEYENNKKNDKYGKKLEKVNDSYFSNIYFEDIEIKSYEKTIQNIVGVNKKEQSQNNRGIPQVIETISKGNFDINVFFFKNKAHGINFDYEEFKKYIKEYSNIIITREKHIFDNIGLKKDFINQLDDLHKNGKYPIKIGMLKKSLSYKVFWEKILKDFVYINQRFDNKNAKKYGVGDKSIYLTEDNLPIGWIILEF